MKHYFAYIRVSTQKQGSKGVSLQEQRSAIEAHAQKANLRISEWFEERETAAKTGRAQFTQIMKRLRRGEASGLIIHKIDRSARNLKDWAALGELIDKGKDVQIASETYDLNSRGGRLSADIQAVIAADYIRNLREETIKGMWGRLKQGLYPLRAPVGYVDTGGGKAKEIHPTQGPLIRQTFELYASGAYSLRELETEMYKRGLRSLVGKKLPYTSYSRILNNPFYAGTIRLKSTGETFDGVHRPIISKSLFKRVQRRLQGKARRVEKKHGFIFARKFKCKLCGYSVIGETQKDIQYYRCHTKGCPMKGIREDELLDHLRSALKLCSIKPEMFDCLQRGYLETSDKIDADLNTQKAATDLTLAEKRARLERLTDLFIDGDVASEMYATKKAELEAMIEELSNSSAELEDQIGQERQSVEQFLEHAEHYISSARSDLHAVARDISDFVTSNRLVSPKTVEISIDPRWLLLTKSDGVAYCGLRRNKHRTQVHQDLKLAA